MDKVGQLEPFCLCLSILGFSLGELQDIRPDGLPRDGRYLQRWTLFADIDSLHRIGCSLHILTVFEEMDNFAEMYGLWQKWTVFAERWTVFADIDCLCREMAGLCRDGQS